MIVGLDISFKRTGICQIDSNSIAFATVGLEIGEKTYANVFNQARVVANGVLAHVPADSLLISEEPVANSSFSSGLYCLDSLIFDGAIKQGVKTIYTTHPSYIGYLHQTRSYHKSDSVALAEKFLKVFADAGYSILRPSRLPHDCAEALFIALRGYLLQAKNSVLIDKLFEVNERLKTPKERILFKGE